MQVFKPEDLDIGEFAQRSADSAPPFFAVFGKPIAHSLSPLMQNAAIEKIAARNAEYKGSKYFAFEVDPANLKDALEKFRHKGFLGINLTIPHKEVVMDILGDLDAAAKNAGACNTLLRTESGWKGFNTDGLGLEKAVEKNFGRGFENAEVVLIGAGGAARGAAFTIAPKCKKLSIVNRSPERLEKLAADLRSKGFSCETLALGGGIPEIGENAIIINSTSIGLKDGDSPVINFSKLPKSAVFYDMPYRRDADTASVAAAKANGIKAADGLSMLAWQGAIALNIWTGEPVDGLGGLMFETLEGARK